jgi:hypothetical protein
MDKAMHPRISHIAAAKRDQRIGCSHDVQCRDRTNWLWLRHPAVPGNRSDGGNPIRSLGSEPECHPGPIREPYHEYPARFSYQSFHHIVENRSQEADIVRNLDCG